MKRAKYLTITLELLAVATQPGRIPGSSLDSVGAVSTLAQTTALATGRGQSTHFAMLHGRGSDPVDTRVVANLLVGRIDHDDFVVLHGGVLVDPVTVQHTQIGVTTSGLFFRHTLQVAFKLEVVDTLMLGLTKHHTTMVLAFAASATDTGADNHVSLLGLVAETVSLVRTGRLGAGENVGALAVFPGAAVRESVKVRSDDRDAQHTANIGNPIYLHSKQETEGVTLLVTPKLFHVLVATHCYSN